MVLQGAPWVWEEIRLKFKGLWKSAPQAGWKISASVCNSADASWVSPSSSEWNSGKVYTSSWESGSRPFLPGFAFGGVRTSDSVLILVAYSDQSCFSEFLSTLFPFREKLPISSSPLWLIYVIPYLGSRPNRWDAPKGCFGEFFVFYLLTQVVTFLIKVFLIANGAMSQMSKLNKQKLYPEKY